MELLDSSAAQAWLAAHAADDPARLLLAAHRWPDLPIRELVAQLAARQKARTKLPGWATNPALRFPVSLSVEQASSEATARFKAGLVAGADSLADLTGGFGVDAWHFAQTVGRVTYVEHNAELAAVVAHNAAQLSTPNLAVLNTTAEAWLAQAPPDSQTWLYLDPARRDGAGRRVAALADCTPDVPALLPELLRVAPGLLLKTAPLLDLTAATRALGPGVREIIVVELSGEAKEVLYLLTREASPAPPLRRAVLLAPDGAVAGQFAPFTEAEEAAATVAYGLPEACIFEPAAAVLKAGALRLTAARYGLRKLHPQAQLYTGAAPVPGFPGRQWHVRGTARYDRNALHALLPEGRAGVTTRHFPADAPTVRKKLGLADGGPFTVLATTGPDGKPLLVVGERV